MKAAKKHLQVTFENMLVDRNLFLQAAAGGVDGRSSIQSGGHILTTRVSVRPPEGIGIKD